MLYRINCIIIYIDNNIHLFNVKYNTNSYNNYNIADTFRQNLSQHVYCFDCKMALSHLHLTMRNFATCRLRSSSKARNKLHWQGTLSKFDIDIYHSTKS